MVTLFYSSPDKVRVLSSRFRRCNDEASRASTRSPGSTGLELFSALTLIVVVWNQWILTTPFPNYFCWAARNSCKDCEWWKRPACYASVGLEYCLITVSIAWKHLYGRSTTWKLAWIHRYGRSSAGRNHRYGRSTTWKLAWIHRYCRSSAGRNRWKIGNCRSTTRSSCGQIGDNEVVDNVKNSVFSLVVVANDLGCKPTQNNLGLLQAKRIIDVTNDKLDLVIVLV